MDKKDLSIDIDDDVKLNIRVGAILEYNGKVIIEKFEEADWGVLPGGRVKEMEDTKEAIVREIKEEMHFDISKKDITFKSIVENFYDFRGKRRHELFFIYKIKLNDEDEIVNINKENFRNYDSTNSWYEYVDILNFENERILPEVVKDIVKDASNKITRYVVKE